MIGILAATFISVQVGSFSEEGRAVHVVEDLRSAGFEAYFLPFASAEDGVLNYKVRVGGFGSDRAAADKVATRLKARGAQTAGSFVTQTDLAETVTLSNDLVAMIGSLGMVNPGRIAALPAGAKYDEPKKRLPIWTQNYLTLFLLGAGQTPGKLTDLAVWDANPDNHAEIFAVLDATRALALSWKKEESRYGVLDLLHGTGLSVPEALDLVPGPYKFICVRYESGGDLFSEKGYRVYRWVDEPKTFVEVGNIPLERVDHGEESGGGFSQKRVIRETRSIDADPDREVIVDDTVVIGKDSRTHVDVWDWDGTRLERVEEKDWFEKVLAENPSSADAASALFGAGIERGLSGDLAGALSIFQVLVTRHPEFEEAKRAEQAIKQIGERRAKAAALTQAGLDEARAGAPELGEQDLRSAVVYDPGNALAWYNLAVARATLANPLGAARALRKALALDKDATDKLRERAGNEPAFESLRATPDFKELFEP